MSAKVLKLKKKYEVDNFDRKCSEMRHRLIVLGIMWLINRQIIEQHVTRRHDIQISEPNKLAPVGFHRLDQGPIVDWVVKNENFIPI